ncbi:nitroreductase family protein [Terrisporobacter sp.]
MLEVIKTRRSIRTYIEKEVEEEKIMEILRAAMQAPSSKNSSPWEFAVVDDKKLLEELSRVHHKAKHIKDANKCIVVLGNRERFLKPGKWIHDLGACTENILLECTNQKLASSWVGVHPKPKVIDKVREALNLPEHLIPYSIVAIGYSNEKDYFKDKFDKNKIHRNRFE